jgi:FixJ family two-component response regulator
MIFSQAEDCVLANLAFQQFIIRHLDAREMLILNQLIRGKTCVSIAEDFACSRRFITRLVTNIRAKANKYFSSH